MQVIHKNTETTDSKRAFFASGFFRHLFAIALRLPNCNGEQETQRHFFGRVLPAAVVTIASMIAIPAITIGLFSSSAYATESKLDLTMSSDTISLDISSVNASGTFKKSADNTITASTDNLTGYTLSIKSTDTSASTTPPALINGDSSMPSITSALTEEQFSAITATNYNNKYGYLPSKLNSATNTSFLPSPDLTGNIIDCTSTANTSPNEYTMAIGARVDQTIPFGTYSNTFEVLLVANAIPYTIIYNDGVVGNMPVDVDTTSEVSNVTISSNIPTRNGYSFTGWCDTTPTTSGGTDTCSGTTYSAGSTYTLDRTGTNNLTLYAMWTKSGAIGSLTYLQDFNDLSDSEKTSIISSMEMGVDYTLKDKRDNKSYTIAKNCVAYSGSTCSETQLWMTQNLDLVLGSNGVGNLTSELSDINSDLGTKMGYSTSGGIITWTPASTLTTPATISGHSAGSNTISGWTNSNYIPYQGEGGDYYIFSSRTTDADTIYSSLSVCTSAGYAEEQCNHYHVGNYYNWSAAVAGNDTSSYTTDLTVMPNSICPAGWRLPNGLTSSSGTVQMTEFNKLALANGVTNSSTTAHSSDSDRWVNVGWTTYGFDYWRHSFVNSKGDLTSTWFTRSGLLNDSTLYYYGTTGRLWSSTVRSSSWGYYLDFHSSQLNPASQYDRNLGLPIRCVAR